jgi:hypothetical protein
MSMGYAVIALAGEMTTLWDENALRERLVTQARTSALPVNSGP